MLLIILVGKETGHLIQVIFLAFLSNTHLDGMSQKSKIDLTMHQMFQFPMVIRNLRYLKLLTDPKIILSNLLI